MTRCSTAVVLGAGGFLGRHAADALRTAGWRVVSVSRHAPVSVDLVRCSSAELRALFRTHRPDVVVNAVGLLWGPRLDPAALIAANAELPTRLAAAAHGRRLVHLGSVYEYGDHRPDTVIDESTQERPRTAYGTSKLAGSRAILDAGGTVLRVTTTIGAGAPQSSFLGGLAARLAVAPPGVLHVPVALGERDFVPAVDVGDAVVAAVRAPQTGLFNVGFGRPVPPRSLVDLLVEASGAPVTVVAEQATSTVRGGAVPQRISIAAARTVLDWKPQHTLADAVRALWRART